MRRFKREIERFGLYRVLCVYGSVAEYLVVEYGMGSARAQRIEDYLYG